MIKTSLISCTLTSSYKRSCTSSLKGIRGAVEGIRKLLSDDCWYFDETDCQKMPMCRPRRPTNCLFHICTVWAGSARVRGGGCCFLLSRRGDQSSDNFRCRRRHRRWRPSALTRLRSMAFSPSCIVGGSSNKARQFCHRHSVPGSGPPMMIGRILPRYT